MKSCPHCNTVKEMMEKKDINFIERDIDDFDDEYQKVIVENTKNEYLPAFCLLDIKEEKSSSEVTIMTPDDDFESLEEAVQKIEKFLI